MLTKKRVVFYLVDGARPDILSGLVAGGLLPNFARIAEEGTYRTATSCFPSTTGPAYLPFLTGHFPGTIGITGIRWFDKTEFKKSRVNRYAMRSYCGPEAALFNTDMPDDKPTLFELMGRAYNLYNMITRSVPDEFDLGKKGKKLLYTRAHFLKRHHPVDLQGHQRMMDMLRSGNDFDFLFSVFPSVDWDSHYYHYRDNRTVEAYKIADQSLGEVREFLEKKGWWKDTLFVLTSDHGLTPTHSHLDLGDWMTAHDLKSVYYPVIWKRAPKSAVMISGNSFGSIHLLNHQGAHVLREQELKQCFGDERMKALLGEDAVNFIAYRGEEENSFYVENDNGRACIRKSKAAYSYHADSGDPFSLGNDLITKTHREALESTFDSPYPDALVQIAQLFQSRRAGDVVVGAKRGFDLRDFWEYPEHRGSHGSLDKDHMLVPLLYNQRGWASHPARTADIFNTILKWSGRKVISGEGESLF
ncbi:alkaline phosphatase family protein [Arcticibacter tournemirensis]|uniref:alkaline phosphatase family protein n=1 Tax=Arcticibacter tournemirensis TaxID=699437 RepID=UPI00138683E4|nr:alkaline phosphatase family protein [Arcticibacter tournemirensis]